jgi:hypothetical protein
MDELQQIAAGDAVPWSETFKHPQHGELTARVANLPKNRDWLKHANECDLLIREMGGDPNAASEGTTRFAGALAGFRVIFAPIVTAESRTVDPEDGHERIEKHLYDPMDDENMEIPVRVWLNFCDWRQSLLNRAGDLGKSSGETNGNGSDASSPVDTDSPSTTPA